MDLKLSVGSTVQVQLSLPELQHTCCLNCSLSYCVDSKTFSDRNQSTGRAMARITIAWHAESEHSFYPIKHSPGFGMMS